ncbi:HIT family protein [Aquabacterium olei]|jgi:histidine triad (HIT) family protein|uniref:HIT family protein n=1 Tax=Aquabacterium olei TaxID=1296669 RepID=A0A2U8FNU8_9BURK|nr:HIT family protein [Aquabacterium olei]AWI52731.1 HIT family protein [Aquabacterium olei]
MAYDTNNVFAKMLRGEIPCFKLYEDEHTLAFMDIMPQAEGHALVIPKEAATTLFELSDEAAQAVMRTVRRIGNAQKQALGAEGIVLMQLNGAAAGQSVPHFHVHVIPGSIADLRRPHATVAGDMAQIQALGERIRAALA